MADSGTADEAAPGNFRALLWLSFLRGVLLLAAALALAGAWLIAAFVSGNSGHVVPVPDAFGFWLVFSPLALLIGAAWASRPIIRQNGSYNAARRLVPGSSIGRAFGC